MYLGCLVELAESRELYRNPLHPYTRSLLQAVPIPDPQKTRSRPREALQGEIPSPLDSPPGCRFSTLCPRAVPRCHEAAPELREAAPGHHLACHLEA
jgi:oligopeptide transport system ATP-binding protein